MLFTPRHHVIAISPCTSGETTSRNVQWTVSIAQSGFNVELSDVRDFLNRPNNCIAPWNFVGLHAISIRTDAGISSSMHNTTHPFQILINYPFANFFSSHLALTTFALETSHCINTSNRKARVHATIWLFIYERKSRIEFSLFSGVRD
jgi:hypothetical protein